MLIQIVNQAMEKKIKNCGATLKFKKSESMPIVITPTECPSVHFVWALVI
jgi:hypothetical protein